MEQHMREMFILCVHQRIPEYPIDIVINIVNNIWDCFAIKHGQLVITDQKKLQWRLMQ